MGLAWHLNISSIGTVWCFLACYIKQICLKRHFIWDWHAFNFLLSFFFNFLVTTNWIAWLNCNNHDATDYGPLTSPERNRKTARQRNVSKAGHIIHPIKWYFNKVRINNHLYNRFNCKSLWQLFVPRGQILQIIQETKWRCGSAIIN